MTWGWVLAIAVPAIGAVRGADMVARPRRYLGSRAYDAHDPRTVRWFGVFCLIITAPIILFSFFQFFSE